MNIKSFLATLLSTSPISDSVVPTAEYSDYLPVPCRCSICSMQASVLATQVDEQKEADIAEAWAQRKRVTP